MPRSDESVTDSVSDGISSVGPPFSEEEELLKFLMTREGAYDVVISQQSDNMLCSSLSPAEKELLV